MQTVYEVLENSDKTEGRGVMVQVGLFTDLDEAVLSMKGHSIMGRTNMTDCEIFEIGVFPDAKSYIEAKPEQRRKKIWGYRKSPVTDKYGEGFMDGRDEKALLEDPEFEEFKRLREKFGDVG